MKNKKPKIKQQKTYKEEKFSMSQNIIIMIITTILFVACWIFEAPATLGGFVIIDYMIVSFAMIGILIISIILLIILKLKNKKKGN